MKTKIFTLIIFAALLTLCSCSATFTENEFFAPVGDAVWDDAKNFSEGFAAVKKGDLWGFINENGEVAIEPQFESVWNFTQGLAAVQKDGLWGYVNSEGEMVIDAKFSATWGFYEGLAAVQAADVFGLYGYIDLEGEYVFEPQFTYAKNFKNGIALVQLKSATSIGHKYSFAKADGTLLTDTEWFGAEEFSEGLAEVYMTYESAFIDENANVVIDYVLDDAKQFTEGVAAFEDDLIWGYINADGETLIEPKYDEAEPFSQGIAVVELDRAYGYINKNGDEITEINYKYAYSAKEGRARVGKLEAIIAQFGYIDLEGKEVIPPKYFDAKDFSQGYAAVKTSSGGKWNLIDIDGNPVTGADFDKIEAFKGGYTVYEINGKYGHLKIKTAE